MDEKTRALNRALRLVFTGGCLLAALVLVVVLTGPAQHLKKNRYLPSILAGMSFAGFWFYLGWRWRVRQQLLAGLTVRRISRQVSGLTMLRGEVWAPDRITDPISGAPCSVVVMRVERQILSTRYRDWEKVAQEIMTQGRELLIDDGQGRARVMLQPDTPLTMDMPPTFVSPVWRVPDIPEHSRVIAGKLLEKSVLGTGENGRTKVWVLRHGDQVQVLGTATPLPAGANADLELAAGSDGLLGCTTRGGAELAADYRTKALAGLYGGGALFGLTLLALLYAAGLAH